MKKDTFIAALFFLVAILIVLLGVYLATLPPRDVTLRDMEYGPARPVTDKAGMTRAEKMDEKLTGQTMPEQKLPEQKVTKDISSTTDTADYYIILGSYSGSDQARKMFSDLKKTYSDSILILPPTPQGYFRIGFGRFDSKEKARKKLEKIKSGFDPNVWILTIPK